MRLYFLDLDVTTCLAVDKKHGAHTATGDWFKQSKPC